VRACQAGRDPLTSDDDCRSTDGVTIEFSRVVRIGDVAKRPCPGAPQRAACRHRYDTAASNTRVAAWLQLERPARSAPAAGFERAWTEWLSAPAS
jgi:hypothetical protein